MRALTLIVSTGFHVLLMSAAASFAERRAPPQSTPIRLVRVERPKPPSVSTPSAPEKPVARPRDRAPARGSRPAEPAQPAAKPRASPTPDGSTSPEAFDSGIQLGNGGSSGLEVPRPSERAKQRAEPKPAPAAPKLLRAHAGPSSAEACDAPPTKPQPIERPAAIEYSAKARADGVEGRLVLSIKVGADGRVSTVDVQSSVDPALDEAAVEAVKTWRFEPARRCGTPVEASYVLARRFELGD
jgi:periplasmic protein TonB